MSELRNIVVILGNGFDLDLGLQTSYKDFWESEYCPKDYPAPLIKHLNECWPDSKETVKWYDLENGLWNYYDSIRKTRIIPDVLTAEEKEFVEYATPLHIQYGIDNKYHNAAYSMLNKGYLVQNYLSIFVIPYRDDMLQSSNWRDQKAFQLIKEGLCKYLTSIYNVSQASGRVSFQVLANIDEEAKKGSEVNVYTFNYTPVLLNGSKLDAAKVHYMHGSCSDGKIIIGTRDDIEFSPSYDFLQKSFDPSFNPPAIVANLQEADEVVIFGHSIGENDRQYFKAFFKQQTDFTNKHGKDITIFTKDSDSEHQIKRSLQSMTDGNLSSLFSLNNLQIIKTGELEEDKEKLLDFLVKHGKDELATREFIGRCMHSDS